MVDQETTFEMIDQETIFEDLVAPESEAESFVDIGLHLRDEAWIESMALPQVRELGMRMGCEQAVKERFRRARVVGLASVIFLQMAPIENEVRAFVREQLISRGLWRGDNSQ
jgi:hypothetical protein